MLGRHSLLDLMPAPMVPAADASQGLWGQMREGLLAAAHSLANKRLRSLLTTVGIIAGVASRVSASRNLTD